ncbi:hypothetical protein D3C75_960190 [compost metagenome]
MHLLAHLGARRIAQGHQLLQGIGGDMGVLDIEHEADVRQPLGAIPVVDVVDEQHLQRGQPLLPGGPHAAHDPAVERVVEHGQAELQLREGGGLGRDEMGR